MFGLVVTSDPSSSLPDFCHSACEDREDNESFEAPGLILDFIDDFKLTHGRCTK